MISGLSVLSIGPVAAEILSQDGEADIAAVFERSCYVMATHGYVAIGGETLGNGPLNILLQANLGPLDWIRLGVTREAKGAVVNNSLTIGEHFVLRLSDVPVWQPPPWPKVTATALKSIVMAVTLSEA